VGESPRFPSLITEAAEEYTGRSAPLGPVRPENRVAAPTQYRVSRCQWQEIKRLGSSRSATYLLSVWMRGNRRP